MEVENSSLAVHFPIAGGHEADQVIALLLAMPAEA